MNEEYTTVRIGTVHETRELVPGEVFADFDASGKLLGVEVLKPTNKPDNRSTLINVRMANQFVARIREGS